MYGNNLQWYTGAGWELGFQVPSSQIRTTNLDFQTTWLNLLAEGDIYPSRFVTMTSSGGCVQSVLGDSPIGVSQNYPFSAVGILAAQNGIYVRTYSIKQECWIELGANVGFNEYLAPDNDGKAIGVTSGTSKGYAVSLQGGFAGQLIRCRLTSGKVGVDYFCSYTCEYSDEFVRCPC